MEKHWGNRSDRRIPVVPPNARGRALGEGIEIETVVAGGLWNTRVDPMQVETALLNLVINACDAMDGHGKLTIEAGNAFLDDNYALRHAEVTPGQYVMIAVSDTGCSIDPEILEKVFDPFFSTKPEGRGSGLGLSMVHGFVKQSGGQINIYSEVGHGSTVRLYLPRSREDEDARIELGASPFAGGSETILLVEDDEDVRVTTAELLSELGYSAESERCRQRSGYYRKRRRDRPALYRHRDARHLAGS